MGEKEVNESLKKRGWKENVDGKMMANTPSPPPTSSGADIIGQGVSSLAGDVAKDVGRGYAAAPMAGVRAVGDLQEAGVRGALGVGNAAAQAAPPIGAGNAVEAGLGTKVGQFADRYNPMSIGVTAATGMSPREWGAEAVRDPKGTAQAVIENGTSLGWGKKAAGLLGGDEPAAGPPGAAQPADTQQQPTDPYAMPAAPQPYMVGARDAPIVDPRSINNYHNLIQDERDATARQGEDALDMGDALSQQKLREGEGHAAMGSQREQYANEMRGRADTRAADLEQKRQRIDAESVSVAQRSKEDPDQWWNSQGTGKQVGWSLATFLSGFSGKDHNEVLGMMRDHVKDNISAQRQDYMHDRNRIDDMNNLYAQAYRATGDHDAAYDLAQNWQMGALQDKVNAMAAESGSGVEVARAKYISDGLERERAQIGQKGVLQEAHMHKYLPAHMEGGPSAAGHVAPDWDTQRKISEMLDKQRVPAARASYAYATKLLKDPESHLSPTLQIALRAAVASGNPDNVNRLMAVMNPKQRALNNALFQMATTESGEEGMRNFNLVLHNYAKNIGTGSPEDMGAGLGNSRAIIEGRYRDSVAGFDPAQVQIHEYLRGTSALPADLQKPEQPQRPASAVMDK